MLAATMMRCLKATIEGCNGQGGSDPVDPARGDELGRIQHLPHAHPC